MKITVCIGSSCHLKGSRMIVEEFKRLIAEKGLANQVDLSGKFCMGNCEHGVCVTIDGEIFSVQPEGAGAFFENEVVKRL